MLDYDGQPMLDYAPCRYGESKVDFRGPLRALKPPYIACLGGTEFYGKYLHHPIPDLLEEQLGETCLNLGRTNAGLDMFAVDAEVMRLASQASVAVVQITSAHNISNRFYTLHPRRNDRFIAPTELLRAVFPEVDFTTIHFTRHALQELRRVSPSRFRVVVDELKSVWTTRMLEMLSRIDAQVVLFWMGDHSPDHEKTTSARDPLFVDRTMLEVLRPHVAQIVECIVSIEAQPPEVDDMVCKAAERDIARFMFGPKAHAEAVAALLDPVREALQGASTQSSPKYA